MLYIPAILSLFISTFAFGQFEKPAREMKHFANEDVFFSENPDSVEIGDTIYLYCKTKSNSSEYQVYFSHERLYGPLYFEEHNITKGPKQMITYDDYLKRSGYWGLTDKVLFIRLTNNPEQIKLKLIKKKFHTLTFIKQ